jgi:hypothetical protein
LIERHGVAEAFREVLDRERNHQRDSSNHPLTDFPLRKKLFSPEQRECCAFPASAETQRAVQISERNISAPRTRFPVASRGDGWGSEAAFEKLLAASGAETVFHRGK